MRTSRLLAMCLATLSACAAPSPNADDDTDTATDTDGLPDTGETDTDTDSDSDSDTDTDTDPDTDTRPEFAQALPRIQIVQEVGCALRPSGELVCWGGEPPDTGKWLIDDEFLEVPSGTWRLLAHTGLNGLVVDATGRHVEPWPAQDGFLLAWSFLENHPVPWVGISSSGIGVSVCAIDALGMLYCDELSVSPPTNPGWRTVEVGWNSACAIHRTDGLACWGEPEEYGTLPQDHPDALAVSVGSRSTCVVTANRGVACAGWPAIVDNLPTGISDVESLDVGGPYACARHTNGEVTCWGHSTTTPDDAVVHDVPPGPFADVSTLTAACAIRPTGEILCWGTGSGGVTNPP